MLARPNERELGIAPSDLEFLMEQAREIPFEPAMAAVARLAAANWHIARDGEAQLALAGQFFDGAPVIERLAAFVRGERGDVIFSEQQFFVVQRLLVDYAHETDVEDQMSEAEFANLRRLIIGAATIVDDSYVHLEQAATTGVEMLAFLVQNGAYNARPNLLNSFARAYALFVERARSADGLSLDQWVDEDYPLTLEEQFAAGFALQALAKAIDDDVSPGERALVDLAKMSTTAFAERHDDISAMLAASRQWYIDAFAVGDQGLVDIAWETTPFLQRPFLELSSGALLLISPRSIITWLGDGFYYRLLEAAQRRNTPTRQVSLDFTIFVGDLLERWALELVRSAYSGDRPPGGGRVHGEQPYGNGQLTPDVAIDLGPDLVLIEVRSGYLSRRLRVGGDPNELRRDLERVLFRKVRQLGDRIVDIFERRAVVPDVDVGTLVRVWPIVVTADITLTEPLYDWIEAELPPIYGDARVQSLLVCDPEDLELLLGMVEYGASLTGLLDSRQDGPFRKLEFKRWALEDPTSPGETRPTYALERWERVNRAVRDVLQLPG